jgi:hypothetical protein
MKKTNFKLGAFLALFGGLLGLIGHFVIFMNWFEPALAAESAEPGCEILLKYLMPSLSDVGMLAGTLYLVAAYAFWKQSGWGFKLAVVANVLALQGSWFLNVPLLSADLPPIYFPIFFPNLLLFFLFMVMVEKRSWSLTLVALATGMTFVFTLMNGVASWSRILTIGTPLFIFVQRSHWISMLGWGVVTVGIILKPKEWMRYIAMAAALLELVVGIPLAIATAIDLGRFSLFSFGPISSLILLIILLVPNLWERWTETEIPASDA